MTIWAPGMRCVCVIECPSDHAAVVLGASYPRKGEVVTVRAVNVWSLRTLLRFEEHFNEGVPRSAGSIEPGFNSAWFRPLSETRLDQFRVHLNRRPVDLPIAAPLVSRPVSVRGAAVPPMPAAPHPHPLPVSRAANPAQRQVVQIVPRVAALGRPSVAAEVFEEFELSSSSCFHGSTIPWSALPCPTTDFPRATKSQAD